MRLRPWFLVVSLLAGCAVALAQPAGPSWVGHREELETWLVNAEVLEVKDIGEGVTNPKKVTLKMGETVFHAVYKPLKRGRKKGFWESYQAEVAAYELDKLLGLDMVPPTVVRRVGSDLGSLQLWVDGCDTYKRLEPRVPQSRGFSRQISRMKMFDNLIYNEDRNAGNFLLDESWRIILIDHSRAFLDRKNLLKESSKLPVQYDRHLVERLEALDLETLEVRLKDLLMGGQIESILKRRDRILEHERALVAKQGEQKVLFD